MHKDVRPMNVLLKIAEHYIDMYSSSICSLFSIFCYMATLFQRPRLWNSFLLLLI